MRRKIMNVANFSSTPTPRQFFRIRQMALFALLFSATIMAQPQGVALLKGNISNPTAYFLQGKFHQKVVRFYFDNLLQSDEIIVVPSPLGEFDLQLPLLKPMPVWCDYDGQITLLYLSPNDSMQMSFNADNLVQTLKYKGKGAAHNTYCQQMHRQYASDVVETELRTRREQLSTKAAYMPLCENYKQRELSFLQNYIAQTPTSVAFQTWARNEAKYRYAVRMAAWYFRSNDKQTDDYKQYAKTLTTNDHEAIHANQYLQFLDYHLRNLSMRDSDEVRQNREKKGIPWIVRAFELAQTELQGKTREYALAKYLIDLIAAEYSQCPALYEIFKQHSTDPFAQQAVEKHYGQLIGFMNAEPLPDAYLHVIDEDYNLSFSQLLEKYKGKVIYIDFWASWCAPCLGEMPYSNNLQKAYKDKNIVFLYLTPDDHEGKWRGNIARHQLSGEFYLMSKNLKNDSFVSLGVRALPHYALIDKQGNVAIADARKPSNALLRDDIDNLLNKP
jgi:thiol-disulfide isomerase/thioredoxin